jgi:DNA-directed RNA polymerase subunit M/transcription elongation factor TFIIS
MSEVRTFFRFCPSCGRRFHIRLVSKKLVSDRKETYMEKRAAKSAAIATQLGRQPGIVGTSPLYLEEDVPVTIDVEDFQYSYKCRHCGHEWTESRTETHREG